MLRIYLQTVLLFAFVFFGVGAIAQSEYTLMGTVVDSENQEPLIGASIQWGNQGTTTDVNGQFVLKGFGMTGEMVISYLGYTTKTLLLSPAYFQEERLIFDLVPSAILLETPTVTSGKFQKPLGEVTVSLEVLKPSVIDDNNAVNIDDALQKVPSLSIIDGQANIRGGSGYSYGAGSRVMLLLDDLPYLQADAGFPNWADIPVENIQQVEVLKGAASALYGSAAMNGIINIRTAYPKDEPFTKISTFGTLYNAPKDLQKKWWGPETTLPMQLGMRATHRQKFNKLDLILGGALLMENKFSKGDSTRSGRITANTRYRFTEKISAGVNVNLNRTAGASFFYWANDTTGAYTPAPNTITNNDNVRFTVDPYLSIFDGNDNHHKVMGRYMRVNNNNSNDQSITSDLYYGEYQFQKSFEAQQLTLTSGIVGTYSSITAKLYGDTTFTSSNQAIYVQADKKFGSKLNISLGGRYEANTISSPAVVNGDSIPNPVVSEAKPVFRFGVNYQALPFTYLRGSFGQGYRFPTVAEKFISTNVGAFVIIPNPDLFSETGWSSEIGIKQGFKMGGLSGFVDVAGFWTSYQDMMEFTLTFGPSGIGFQSQNIGNTEIYGLDFSVGGTGNIGKVECNIIAGYTFIEPRFVEFDTSAILSGVTPNEGQINAAGSSSNINVLKYRNKHTAKFDLGFKWKTWSWGLASNYGSHMEAIDFVFESFIPGLIPYREANDKGYFYTDIRLAKEWNGLKVGFLVKNLFNAEYRFRPALLEGPRNYSLRVDYTIPYQKQ